MFGTQLREMAVQLSKYAVTDANEVNDKLINRNEFENLRKQTNDRLGNFRRTCGRT